MKRRLLAFDVKRVALICILMITSIMLVVPMAEAQIIDIRGLETWYWTGSTQIKSVDLANVAGDGQSELITGGWYNDGVRDRAQLAVWKRASSTITLEAVEDAYVNASSAETNYGSANSVYVSANSEQDFTYLKYDLTSIPAEANIVSASMEVYLTDTGGDIYWLPADKIGAYYCSDNSWTESEINWNNKPSFNSNPTDTWSFGIIYYIHQYKAWDVTTDVKTALSSGSLTEVLKFASKAGDGFAFFQSGEATNKPKLIVKYFISLENTLTLNSIANWYWSGNTRIESVCSKDLDDDYQIEIVTGGCFNDGVRDVAQLCVWDGATLTLENVKSWYWGGDTWINSVAAGDVDADNPKETVTGGYYFDGSRNNAQLTVWGTA